MRRRLARALVPCLLAIPAPSAAQGPGGTATLEGTARDAASGRGLLRGYVCTSVATSRIMSRAMCAPVDSTGAYRLDSLPEGKLLFGVSCEMRGRFGRALATDSIDVAHGARVRRDWIVDASGCDARPLRRVAGTFRGFWTPGFESSEFVPCGSDAWFVPGDSLRTEPYDERRAWAWLREGSIPEDFEWPAATEDRFGNPTFYVHWRGTIVGPGRYGHMGVSPFEIQVDSVIELRAPRAGDCAPVG